MLYFSLLYKLDSVKVTRKKKVAADLNESLPGGWFNWVGHFGKSIRGINGTLLAVSIPVNQKEEE